MSKPCSGPRMTSPSEVRRNRVKVFRIRILIRRILMFLGLLDPDPDSLFICTDPALAADPSTKKQKNFCKILISTDLWFLFDCLSLKNDVSVPSRRNKHKNYFCWRLEDHWRKEQGPEPDPLVNGTDPKIHILIQIRKNVTDPEHSFHISTENFVPCFDEIASFCRALHCSLLRCCFGQDCGINFSTTLQIGCLVQQAAVKNILRNLRKKNKTKTDVYILYIHRRLTEHKKEFQGHNAYTI